MSNFHFLFSSRFLLSAGFSASFGISHKRLNFATPGIRFSSHSFCTRLSEMPHFFAASGAEIYSNISFTLSFNSISIIICVQPNKYKILFVYNKNQTNIMEMCITGYSVMDNSIKQSVIRHFHNVYYAGTPIILSFLFKSSIKKSLHCTEPF